MTAGPRYAQKSMSELLEFFAVAIRWRCWGVNFGLWTLRSSSDARSTGFSGLDSQRIKSHERSTDCSYLPRGFIVSRLDTRPVPEGGEIGVGLLSNPLGDVLGPALCRRPPRYDQQLSAGLRGGMLPSRFGHLLAAVPRAQQHLDRGEQSLAVIGSCSIQQRGEVLHVPSQVRPAQLQPHSGLAEELPVGRAVGAIDDPAKGFVQVPL